jgi:DNA-binding SARP family transcriptional activator/TolB-like protein
MLEGNMSSLGTIRLSLLGTPRLEGAGNGPPAVLSQQKRLALLAYLAVRHEFVRREHLVALFWSDLEAERGRAALSQGLHFLRRALGADVIMTRGSEEIRLAPHVWCDTVAFEAALASRRLDDALGLYRGELLSGVDSGLSPEFSFWLDSERTRLHRLAAEAAATRSDQCFRAGDLAMAVKWQRRALELQSTDEVTLRNYLALLDEIGDGASALAEFEAFRNRLEKTFQLEPSRETLRIVDQIRSRRPEASSSRTTQKPVSPEGEVGDAVAIGHSGEPALQVVLPAVHRIRLNANRWLNNTIRTGARRLQFVVVTLVILAAVIAWEWSRSGTTTGPALALDPNRIAVMYLDVRGDTTELGYLADGITEELINNLYAIPTLEVISPSGVRKYRRRTYDPDSAFNRLQVGSLITGEVSGNKYRASVTLRIENRSNVVLKPIRRTFTGGDVLKAIHTITEDIVAELGPALNEAMTFHRMRAGTSSDRAWAYVAQAREKWKVFDEFTSRGPVETAETIAMEADKLLVASIDLDNKWVDPHIMRGKFAMGMAWACIKSAGKCDPGEWLARAIRHANNALKLENGDSRALELRGHARYQLWTFGYADGADRVMKDAESDLVAAAVDRSRATAWTLLGSIYLARSDFAQADNAARKALDADAFNEDRPVNLFTLFRANFHLGNHATAAQYCRELTDVQRGYWPEIFCNLSLLGWTEQIQPDADRALEYLQDESIHEPFRSWIELLVAAVLARAHDAHKAHSLLHDALARANLSRDDEVLHFAAAAAIKLGDYTEARSLLDSYVQAKPAERSHVRKEFWFKPLLQDSLIRVLRDPPR